MSIFLIYFHNSLKEGRFLGDSLNTKKIAPISLAFKILFLRNPIIPMATLKIPQIPRVKK